MNYRLRKKGCQDTKINKKDLQLYFEYAKLSSIVKMQKIKVVIILGPTASGKSDIALDLAERFNAEIVSADSMQVYRYMDIGTAKPPMRYRTKIQHYLIDIADPDEEFSAARYKDEAAKVIDEIHRRGKNILVVGGTGLYIKVLTKGLFKCPGIDIKIRNELDLLANSCTDQFSEDGKVYLYNKLKEVDPDAATRIHPNNIRRIVRALEVYYVTNKPISVLQKEHSFSDEPYKTLKIGLSIDRDILYKRIEDRVENMIAAGFEKEVRRLIEMGYLPQLKAMGGLGYKEMLGYIHNKYSLEEAVKEIKKNTKRYAKRQMTWFKRDTDIVWVKDGEKDKMISLLEGFLV